MTRSISATASSTPRLGTMAIPPKRSGACATYSEIQSLYARTMVEVVLGVGVGDDRPRQAGGRVQHLGVDAVAVHLLETGRGVVATPADVLEADPALHLLGLETGTGVHAEVDRVLHALDDPGVALVEVLDPWGPVLHGGGHPVDPETGRLVDVAVARDEAVAASLRCVLHRSPCSSRCSGGLPPPVASIIIRIEGEAVHFRRPEREAGSPPGWIRVATCSILRHGARSARRRHGPGREESPW